MHRLEKIAEGVKKFLQYQPEVIVAVGGGSAIDSSKAIREFALKINNYGKVGLVAIPTTSGTGSEVTSFAVVNDTEAHVKYPLISDSLTADEAILDAELVRSVPPAITADTGMDVLTHAIESYVSINHNEFTSALAEKAIEICGVYLYRAYVDGNDMHARQKMHVASCLAGLSFNAAGLGITHSMAHQLGAIFHIPHGRANAMLLPHIVEYNANINKRSRSQKEYLPAVKRYSNIAHLLGLSNYNEVMSVRSLVNWIQFMQKEMNIPLTIEEMKTITPGCLFLRRLIRWRIWHLRMPAQRQIRVYRRKRILLRFILKLLVFLIKDENRKGAAKPRPLCTPLGLFLECLTVAGGRVLTCACMLRLFRVERCADGAPWAP